MSKNKPVWLGARQVPRWEELELAKGMSDRLSESGGVSLGKALSSGCDGGVEIEEYRRMAAVEDEMWYYRALHGHIERALLAGFGGAAQAICRAGEHRSSADGRAQPARTILDAGCGTGGLIRRLGAGHRDWNWTGVDLEPLACELARARVGRAEIVQGSVTALPFPDESFDAAVMADVLYHLDDDVAGLRECARVLRPGGRLIVNVPAHRWLWSYHDVAVHGRRRYERDELREKFALAGLKAQRVTHWNTLPLPLVIARRKLWPAPRSGSDVRLYPRAVEASLNGMMAVERGWLRMMGSLPLGSSIFAVATKSAGQS